MKPLLRSSLLAVAALGTAAFALFSDEAMGIAFRLPAACRAFSDQMTRLEEEPGSRLSVDVDARPLPASDRGEPSQVYLKAKITRHVDSTSTTPSREMVMRNLMVVGQSGKPMWLDLPADRGETRIELRFASGQ